MNLFAHNGIAHETFLEAVLHVITSDGAIIFYAVISIALLVGVAKHLKRSATRRFYK